MARPLFEQYKDALRRGHVALLNDELDSALAAYREAASLVPDRPLPYASMAGVLDRLGRPAEAVAAYDLALGLTPDDQAIAAARAAAAAIPETPAPEAPAADSSGSDAAATAAETPAPDRPIAGEPDAGGVPAIDDEPPVEPGPEDRAETLSHEAAPAAAAAADTASLSAPPPPPQAEPPRQAEPPPQAEPAPQPEPAVWHPSAAEREAAATAEAAALDAMRAALEPRSGSARATNGAHADAAPEPPDAASAAPREPSPPDPVILDPATSWPAIDLPSPPPPPLVGPPPDPVWLQADADALVDAGDIAAARDQLLLAVAVHRDAERLDAALDAGLQLLAIAPGDPRVHLAIANLQLDRGWRPVATEKIELLLRLTSLSGDAQAEADVHLLAADRLRDEDPARLDARRRGLPSA